MPEVPQPTAKARISEWRAVGLAFLTGGVALFSQVLVHRVVSAKLLNNYAFLVISLTMLGFALSGVLLTRRLPAFLERFDDAVVACSALFTLTLLAVSVVFYRFPVGPQFPASRSDFLLTFFRWSPLALLYALPFVFCGLILGALLSSPRLPTRRVYCFDLLGSALGAVVVIPAISGLGVETSLLIAGAVLPGRGGPAGAPAAQAEPGAGPDCRPRARPGHRPPGESLPDGLSARVRARGDRATGQRRGRRVHGLGSAGAHRGLARPATPAGDLRPAVPDRGPIGRFTPDFAAC